MYITRLLLSNFGKFHQKELELKPGINILYGENEAGKSTIHNFIKGMLFGIERLRGRVSVGKEDTYTRYLPWDYPGAYQGQMDLLIGEQAFRIHRSFHANDKAFIITDLQTGREIRPEEGYISELIPGLTESTYRNTVSIEQLKAQTDRDLANQVGNYMANLSVARSNEISVDQAMKILNDQRKKLQGNGKQVELQQLQQAIQEGLAKEEQIEQLMVQLKSLEEEQKLELQQWEQSRMNHQEGWKRLDQYPVIVEKYRTYRDYEKQWNQINQEIKVLEEKMGAGHEEQEYIEILMADIEEVERSQDDLHEIEESDGDIEIIEAGRIPGLVISILLGLGIFVLCYLMLGSDKVAIELIAGGITIGISLLVASILQRKKNQRDEEVELDENDSPGYDDNEQYPDTEGYNEDFQEDSEGEYETYESPSMKMEPYEEELSSNIENIFIRYGVKSLEELYELLEECNHNKNIRQNYEIRIQGCEERKSQLEDYRDMLYDNIMGYLDQYFPVDELSENAMLKLHEEVTNLKSYYFEEEKEYKRTLDLCNSRIERLQWEIDHLDSNETNLLINQERYRDLQNQIEQDNKEEEAIRLALETIQELSAEIHDSFGHQLNTAVSRMLGEITGDKYKDIKIDEKLNMKVEWKGNYVPLERFSAGTIDQIYLSMRLAIADLLLDGEEVPLILDDSFAMYDDGRIKMAMELLSKRKQVILFTCHNREQKLLEEMGLPFHFVNLSR